MKKIPQLSDEPDDGSPGEDVARPGAGVSTGGEHDATPLRPSASGDDEVRAEPFGGAPGTGDEPPATATPADRPTGAPGGKASRSRGARRPARGPARRFARERALQALYQWDMADAESSTVRREFIERQDMSRVDVEYFERLFKGVSHDVEKVDAALAEALDRPLVEVDPIERAVLRVAAFELAEVLETPARVVINEGVEITKRFGADNGHRYVNGVLDRLAATLRPLEMRRG